jgi:hypothetical protein
MATSFSEGFTAKMAEQSKTSITITTMALAKYTRTIGIGIKFGNDSMGGI